MFFVLAMGNNHMTLSESSDDKKSWTQQNHLKVKTLTVGETSKGRRDERKDENLRIYGTTNLSSAIS